MEKIIDIFDFILKNYGAMLTILSAVAIMFAYAILLSRASLLGVPFRFARASINESLELLLVIIFGVGFGIITQIYIVNTEMNKLTAFIASFFSVSFGYFIVSMPYIAKFIKYSIRRERKKVGTVLSFSLILIFIAFVSWNVSNINGTMQEISIALFFLILHFLFMVILYIVWLSHRLVGEFLTELVVNIDGNTYLVGVRHSGGVWALFPCEISNEEVDANGYRKKDAIYFERKTYILRKLQDLREPFATYEGYKLIKKNESLQKGK
ncbi:MAG: hypothetical protein FWD44_05560 [Oscillospiraceae bacterium]|nr:hypothetical protein [Oscillospiraceae bacterium]